MKQLKVGGVLLIDVNGNIIAQHRDARHGLNFPDSATFFGGKQKPGEELLETALRELHEETNLRLTADDMSHYMTFTGLGDVEDVDFEFTVYIAKGITSEGFEVFEGRGFHIVTDMSDPLIAPVVRLLFEKWFAEREIIRRAEFERHTPVHHAAAALFVTPDGRLFGHLRDDKPGIDAPGRVGGFGGSVEDGELPLEACIRELQEETNLGIVEDQLELLLSYVIWRPLTKEYEQSTLYVVRNANLDGLEVYEGQGAHEIASTDDPLIAPGILPAVKRWFEVKNG